MKELKILIIVLFFVGLTYWGVEPYAHTKLSPHTDSANYDFAAEDLQLAQTNVKAAEVAVAKAEKIGDESVVTNAKKALQAEKDKQDKYTLFWNEIEKIDFSKGDAATGAETFMNAGCVGCHSVNVAGLPAPMDENLSSEAYGVNPPDISSAGHIYTEKFLAALIKNPPMALKVDHKFNDENMHPMTPFFGLGGDINQELADIVAYLKSIAPKEMSNSEVFHDACQRCHEVRYDKQKATSDLNFVKKYMGSLPPDLSTMIKSRKAEYLHQFINDPQKKLPGTAMPRVGLNENAEKQVVAYLENVGDAKKAERESTTLYIMLYFAILSVFAWLFKRKVWEKLH